MLFSALACCAGLADGVAAFVFGPPSRILISVDEVASVSLLWLANACAMFGLFVFAYPAGRAASLAAIVGAGGAIGANLGLMAVALVRDGLVAHEAPIDFYRLAEFVAAAAACAGLGVMLSSWLGLRVLAQRAGGKT
jgi:hypothetical protein